MNTEDCIQQYQRERRPVRKLLTVCIAAIALNPMIAQSDSNYIGYDNSNIFSHTQDKSTTHSLLLSMEDVYNSNTPGSGSTNPLNPNLPMITPNDKDNQLVQIAFKDFNDKRFDASEKEFSMAIDKWYKMNRPRDEIVSLIRSRANVKLDNKQFMESIDDYNRCLELMKVDGETVDGLGTYPEYPDTFVGRALAYEGLADWNSALNDYNKAVSLYGGKPSTSKKIYSYEEGVNPFVLTFRGNTLTKLNRFDEALYDYQSASDIFNALRDIPRYSDARANYALTLYQVGKEDESVKAMRDIIRKNPGYADIHVALAADSWSRGDYITALKEWRFTCDEISVGCSAYQDENWVRTIRRWPPSLANKLQQFLKREIPDAIKGTKGSILAPKN
eukprot:gene7939-10773_t